MDARGNDIATESLTLVYEGIYTVAVHGLVDLVYLSWWQIGLNSYKNIFQTGIYN